MADLKRITLPSGTTYNIVDQGARDLIAEIESGTGWLGVTTTALTDGAATNPIMVNGESVTAKAGNLTSYQSKEFIFNGTVWQELGDMSMLGTLAYKNSASGSYTPAGTVSQPTFTGTAATITVDTTPSGTVSAPTITVTPATATVNSITEVGTLPDCTLPVFSATVANETLTLGWTAGTFSAGTLPTKGANQTVVTGIQSAEASQPTFTGTSSEGTATYTPTGTVSQPSFTGTAGTVEVE